VIIAADKLTVYVLNMSHKGGAARATLLLSLRYRSDGAHFLELDMRAKRLSLDVRWRHEKAYGVV
jgi:hypothetical protein